MGSGRNCVSSSAALTEMVAMYEGVELALRNQWRKILLEVDAEVVHDVLSGKQGVTRWQL